MNQAALHSSEALAKFDAEVQQEFHLQEDGIEHKRIALRSGRNISNRPYGQMEEAEASMRNIASDSLMRIKANMGREDDEDVLYSDQSSRELMLHPSPPRMAALAYPASSITAPGVDAAAQLATLQAKLNQRLGPEYISTRQGPGGSKLSYIEGWKAIDLANEVFGFNGWSSTIVRMDVDFLDESEGKKWNVGVSVVMRITLRDGTYHEDIGYGHCENVKMKHMALEKARKEASTDGLKRALRTFGRMLGNCLYDRKFIDTASKMKAAVPTYDLTELKRTSAAPQQATPAPQSVPQQASSVVAPVARPTSVTLPQRGPPVQQRQSPQAISQQKPSAHLPMQQHPSTRLLPTRSDKAAEFVPAQVDQQVSHTVTVPQNKACQFSPSAASKPQTKEARLREERIAMAAAKKAELRSKKEREETAKREALGSKLPLGSTNLPLQVNRGEGQNSTDANSDPSQRVSIDEEDIENVDDYDLALMEAGLNDGADLMEEVVNVKGPRAVAKNLSLSSMNDSGIAIVEEQYSRQHHPQQRTGPSAISPVVVGKGRFIDSSPTTRNSGSKLPSSSPKNQIPVKGRRLSLVGETSVKEMKQNLNRSSQEHQSPPSLSQRSRGNRVSKTMQPTPNNRYAPLAPKRSEQSGYKDVQVKRLRNSPY